VLVVLVAIGSGGWLLSLRQCNLQEDEDFILASSTSKEVQLTPELYGDIPLDTYLIHIDKEALDLAYRSQIQHLWNIWLKQQAGDPTAFTTGLRIARRAYAQAAQQIAKRELMLLELERQKNEKPDKQ